MKWTKRSALEVAAALVMTAAVITLAILQYRWTGQISRVEQQRLKAALAASVRTFDEEFSYQFQGLTEAFEIDPEAPSASLEARVSRQYSAWANSNSVPGLLAGILIWKIDAAPSPYLERASENGDRFQQIAWPADFDSLHRFLTQRAANLSGTVDDRQALYYPWMFFDDFPGPHDPVLSRPLFEIRPNVTGPNPRVRLSGFLIVQINSTFIQQNYFPDLVERHFGPFGARSFAVFIRASRAPDRTIYVSDPNVSVSASPDATVNLFDLVGEQARRRGHAPMQSGSASGQWQLVVQHPAGSVEVAVDNLRHRSVAVSFGLLAVLAGSMALVFSAARRAERLARLQVEFVAGVSHELCTPLAVINSAAENIADGIVDTPPEVREYGVMLREQSRRLENVVDQVLAVAAGRAGSAGYELQPVEIAQAITQSLALSEPMLRDAGFAVEKEIGEDLPPVVADPTAIAKCLENLVSNAVKYSNGNRWLGVRARVVRDIPNAEVQICVEDRGIGIPAADLSNIFEPFYRVQGVREGQIRGVGLGLFLVKRMMESMGGRVTVSSRLGKGTFFVLHFPVAGTAEH